MTQLMTAPENGQLTENRSARQAIAVQDSGLFANLLDSGKFEHLWRVAKLFSASAMVPTHFQGKPEDCFIAAQMAIRLGVDPFMFMQNTYVTNGKPGMEGKLAIALINTSGLFRGPVRFEFFGEGDGHGCRAWAILRETGERIDGLPVTIATAKAEGWYQRNKKWQTIPDLMLQYRAGAWFGRAQCPERLMGMQTADELADTAETTAAYASATVQGERDRAKQVLAKITGRPVSEGQTFEPDLNSADQLEKLDAELTEQAAQAQAENDVQAATDALAEEPPQIDLYEEAVKNCDDRKKLLLSAAKEMGVSRADFEGWQFKYLNAKGTNLDSADTQTIADMLRAIKTGKAVWATGTINR